MPALPPKLPSTPESTFRGSSSNSSSDGSSPSAPASNRDLASVCGRVWDDLSEQQRRQQLDAVVLAAARASAASLPVIEQAKGILIGCDASNSADATLDALAADVVGGRVPPPASAD